MAGIALRCGNREGEVLKQRCRGIAPPKSNQLTGLPTLRFIHGAMSHRAFEYVSSIFRKRSKPISRRRNASERSLECGSGDMLEDLFHRRSGWEEPKAQPIGAPTLRTR